MKIRTLIFILTAPLAAACSSDAELANPKLPADSIYTGGDILTLAGDQPEYVEAVAVKDGRIIASGGRKAVMAHQVAATRTVDLQGRTLLPGFYDSHSHFFNTAVKLSTVSLDPPPAGNTSAIANIVAALSDALAARPNQADEWLYGWGYDNAFLKEGRHPTREDLDQVSSEVPIAIMHFSNHVMVLNSKGLELAGFSAESEDPEGGVIRRMPDSREPNGIIEEQAIKPLLLQLMASVQGERLFELLDASQRLYTSNGFTSVLEMGGTPDMNNAFRTYAAQGRLAVDLSSTVLTLMQGAEETARDFDLNYDNRFRIIGGKLNLDGGTPGRTAYLREPYYTQVGGADADYRGYSSIQDQADVDQIVTSFYREGVPVFIHALGDAAVDQAISAIVAARQAYPRKDIRQQLIHLQLFQDDQMEALAGLDVSLTFQNTHNFYFADFHAEHTLGPERTRRLCPTGSAWSKGFNVTIHHDSPVHSPNQLDVMWMAVNRAGRSGTVYGPEEQLTPYQALQASTSNAAWQLFEEKDKGSLEVGKLADMVILDRNPLKVDPTEINQIKVVETIKEGQTIWPG